MMDRIDVLGIAGLAVSLAFVLYMVLSALRNRRVDHKLDIAKQHIEHLYERINGLKAGLRDL